MYCKFQQFELSLDPAFTPLKPSLPPAIFCCLCCSFARKKKKWIHSQGDYFVFPSTDAISTSDMSTLMINWRVGSGYLSSGAVVRCFSKIVMLEWQSEISLVCEAMLCHSNINYIIMSGQHLVLKTLNSFFNTHTEQFTLVFHS